MADNEGVNWEKIINSLTGPFPETGANAPERESILQEGLDLDIRGSFFKVAMDIYFFLDLSTGKYYTMQNQDMRDFGEISLRQAIDLAKKRKRK